MDCWNLWNNFLSLYVSSVFLRIIKPFLSTKLYYLICAVWHISLWWNVLHRKKIFRESVLVTSDVTGRWIWDQINSQCKAEETERAVPVLLGFNTVPLVSQFIPTAHSHRVTSRGSRSAGGAAWQSCSQQHGSKAQCRTVTWHSPLEPGLALGSSLAPHQEGELPQSGVGRQQNLQSRWLYGV